MLYAATRTLVFQTVGDKKSTATCFHPDVAEIVQFGILAEPRQGKCGSEHFHRHQCILLICMHQPTFSQRRTWEPATPPCCKQFLIRLVRCTSKPNITRWRGTTLCYLVQLAWGRTVERRTELSHWRTTWQAHAICRHANSGVTGAQGTLTLLLGTEHRLDTQGLSLPT